MFLKPLNSDPSTHHTSDDFQEELEKNGIECSMSEKGNCHDNAIAKSFFGLLIYRKMWKADSQINLLTFCG
jgi:transposase InsO family protein